MTCIASQNLTSCALRRHSKNAATIQAGSQHACIAACGSYKRCQAYLALLFCVSGGCLWRSAAIRRITEMNFKEKRPLSVRLSQIDQRPAGEKQRQTGIATTSSRGGVDRGKMHAGVAQEQMQSLQKQTRDKVTQVNCLLCHMCIATSGRSWLRASSNAAGH